MTDPTRASVPIEIKLATTIAGLVSQVFAGLLFMSGGGWLAKWGLDHEQHQWVWAGIGLAVLGALFLPSLFQIGQKIYITFFPGGLPIIGGKRAGDPPVPVDQPEVKP